MLDSLWELIGAADDLRAYTKTGISRLITIFVTYVAIHMAISWFFMEYMCLWTVVWTIFGVYITWQTVWVRLNRVTDLAIVGSLFSRPTDEEHHTPVHHGHAHTDRLQRLKNAAQIYVEFVRRLFAVIIITGLGFYFFPTYYSLSLTVGICLAFLLYLLCGTVWNWARWNHLAIAAMLVQAIGLLLKAVNFASFFEDPRNDFYSLPWMWLIFLILIIAGGSYLLNKLPKEPKKEKSHASGH